MVALVRRTTSQVGGGSGAQSVTTDEPGAVAASSVGRAELFMACYFNGTQLSSGDLTGSASGMTSCAYGAAASNNHALEFFIRQVSSAGTGTYGISGTGKGWGVVAFALLDGVDVAATLALGSGSTATSNGTSASPSCGSVSGAAAGDFHLIGFMSSSGGSPGTITTPTGYQVLFTVPEGTVFLKELVSGDLSGGDTSAVNITVQNSCTWVSVSRVLKAKSVSNASFRYYEWRVTQAGSGFDTLSCAEMRWVDGSGTPISGGSWTATASSSYSGNPLSNIKNGSDSDFWETDWSQASGTVGAKAPPFWVRADFGAAQTISALRITPRGGSWANNGGMEYFDLYGSNDGSTWTLLLGGYQPNFDHSVLANSAIEVPVKTVASSGYTITCDAGSLSLTGQSAGMLRALKLAAAAGSVALSGQAMTPKRALKLAAAEGSLSVALQPAGLIRSLSLAAAAGSVAVNGQAVSFTRQARLPAGTGSIALSGQAMTPKRALKMPAAAGSVAVSLQDATLTHEANRTMVAAAGTITLTGFSVTLVRALKMQAAAGDITLDLQPATLRYGSASILPVEAGFLTLDGGDVGFDLGTTVAGRRASFAEWSKWLGRQHRLP